MAVPWLVAEGSCGGDEKHRGGRAGPQAAVRRGGGCYLSCYMRDGASTTGDSGH